MGSKSKWYSGVIWSVLLRLPSENYESYRLGAEAHVADFKEVSEPFGTTIEFSNGVGIVRLR